MNKKQLIVFGVIGIIFCTSLLLSNFAFAREAPEYMLARINAGKFVPEDHETVKRFRHMLEVLQEKTGTPKQEIAEATIATWREVGDKKVGLLEFMEGVYNLVDGPGFERMDYSTVLLGYIAFLM